MQGKIIVETVPELTNLNYAFPYISNSEECLYFYTRPEIFLARMKYH
jgi:hypothetical protein